MRSVNWRQALYSGAAGGGVLWGVLTTLFVGFGADSPGRHREFGGGWWFAAAIATVLALTVAATLVLRGDSIGRRSAGVGVAVAVLSGWLVIGWAAVQVSGI
ncbi:hypothetical protein AB0K11_07450 [Mycobacterium sp. NPDC050551]|uniref:hypothetical protein n=1 Tax=Mycobacterium sp. NPDC050551 TaxID=3155407 RepID=UPI003428C07C